MSSSDEDEFPLVKYGTPLEELEETDIPKKPIAVHEQIVTDEEGRRRFHGAFTGGFSAGYYNTVDTKEGWTPSVFKSSRNERNQKKMFAPEDFMDEEDMAEHGIAPKKIVPQSSFASTNSTDQKTLKRKENFASNATMLLGMDMLQSLIVPVSNNIGVKLLQLMGWKPGQGVGPKVKRRKKKNEFIPENVTFAPEDTVPVDFNAKENSFGLGYTGMDPKLALHDKVKKSSAISLRTKSGAKLSFAGQAFGVGAYEEEDQDIYAQDSMANYDMIMGEEKQDNAYGWSKPTKAITGAKAHESITYVRKVLGGFKKAEKNIRRKIYPPPLLPPDYDPHKRLKLQQGSVQTNVENDKFNRLNPDQRGERLGEERRKIEPISSDPGAVFTLLTPKDRDRLKRMRVDNITQPVVPEKSKRSAFYEPFASNPGKQSRYQQYLTFLREKKTDPYSHIEHYSDMTEWERDQEKEEFTKSSRFFQPLSATMSSRFTSESDELKQQDEKEDGQRKAAKMKMFGMMTRESVEWHPDPLMCKRFNVPNPYLNSDIVGIPGADHGHSMEMFLHPDDFKRKKKPKPPERKSIMGGDDDTEPGGKGKILSDTRNPPLFNHPHHNKSSRWDKEPPIQGPNFKPETEEPDKAEEPSSVETETNERPAMELFKAIFENSDDSSSEDEESSDEEAQPNNILKPKTLSNPEQNTTLIIEPAVETPNIVYTKTITMQSNVNKRSFHKFESKSNRDKKSPVREEPPSPPPDVIAPDGVEEDAFGPDVVENTFGPDVVEDTFGPSLPPVKIPKLWKSTDPESLKPKKSKKSKHKKHKHKDKKKKSR